jgi:5-methyltetrahydrofolate--homocysteine methyltransferase
MALLAPQLKKRQVAAKGTIVLATVRGDIHDIGKNLVDMILSANGYRVINLGIRQSAEDIILAAKRHKPDAIGLSGLLVESVKAMAEYLEIFAAAGLDIPVICGGAALSRQYLEKQMQPLYPAGAHYAKDAMAGLNVLNEIMGQRKRKPGAKTRKRNRKAKKNIGPQQKARQAVSGKWNQAVKIVQKVPSATIFIELDKAALFEKRWKLGRLSQKQRLEAETRLVGLWRILRPMIKPKAVYAIVRDNDPHFESSLLQRQEMLGVQLVTLGTDLKRFKRMAAEEKFLLHGLAAELTEALAKWCGKQLAKQAGWTTTRRVSPGYPVWPELSEQKKIFTLLKPGRIGVRLSKGFQMVPEYSTSAAVAKA